MGQAALVPPEVRRGWAGGALARPRGVLVGQAALVPPEVRRGWAGGALARPRGVLVGQAALVPPEVRRGWAGGVLMGHAGAVGDGLVPSRPEPMHDSDTGDHKGRPYEARAESLARSGAGAVGDGLVPSRPEPMHDSDTGDHKGRPYEARAEARPVPFHIHARPRDGRPQGSPLQARAESLARSGASAVGDGLVPSRPEPMHDSDTGDHKGRPYEARAESLARQAQATTRIAPASPCRITRKARAATRRFDATSGRCRGRACPVPFHIHARPRAGRPQGSPLRGPGGQGPF